MCIQCTAIKNEYVRVNVISTQIINCLDFFLEAVLSIKSHRGYQCLQICLKTKLF